MKILIGLAAAALFAGSAIAQSTTGTMNTMSTGGASSQTAPMGGMSGDQAAPAQSTTTTTTDTTTSSSTSASSMGTHHVMHAKKHCHWVMRHGKRVRSCSTHKIKM